MRRIGPRLKESGVQIERCEQRNESMRRVTGNCRVRIWRESELKSEISLVDVVALKQVVVTSLTRKSD